MTYEPDAGDLVWVDFDPRTGREQSGRRPALVLSSVALYRVSGFVIVCPITSRIRPFGSSVVLPYESAVQGEILTSHVRSIDGLSRRLTPIGKAPLSALAEVRAKLAVLVGLPG